MVEDAGRAALGPHAPGGDDSLNLCGAAGQKMPGRRVGSEEPGVAAQDLGRVALGVERDRDELDRGSPELGLVERLLDPAEDLSRRRADAVARRVDERDEHDLALQRRQVEGLAGRVDQDRRRRRADVGQRTRTGIRSHQQQRQDPGAEQARLRG